MKSIKLLILLSVFVTVSCSEADDAVNSRIIHHNLNAQVSKYPNSFSLDADEDGESDLLFSTRLILKNDVVHEEYTIYPTRANRVFEVAGRAAILTAGNPIAPGNPFDKNLAPLATKLFESDGIRWIGDWVNTPSGYIGFEFSDFKGTKRYGWVRASFSKDEEAFFIHEVAYQLVPEKGIKAGEK